MKTIELTDAVGSVGQYVHNNTTETIVFTENGKAVAALRPINDGDVEDIALSENAQFIKIIARSDEQIRRGQFMSSDEVKKKFGIPSKSKAVKKRVSR